MECISYPDGDILGGSEEPVEQNTHEGGVETKLDLQLGKLGIGHGLRNDNGADGNT